MGREGTTRCSQLTLVFAALGEGLRDNSSLDLAGGGLGQLVDKVHLGGDFEGGKVLLQEGNQFFIGHLLVLLQDDGSLDHLTVHVVGDTKGHGFVDFRVRQHDTIQLNGRNLFTTPVDKFFDSTRENQEALRVEIALVAGPEVVFLLGKVLLVGLWVVGVAQCDVFASDGDFPHLAWGQDVVLIIQDKDSDALWLAHGAWLSLSRGQIVRSHLVRCFGHCVGLQDRSVEFSFQLVESCGRQRRRTRPDEPNVGERRGLRHVQHDHAYRGDTTEPVAVVLDELVPEQLWMEPIRHHNRALSSKGR